jgi:hypothetical protein
MVDVLYALVFPLLLLVGPWLVVRYVLTTAASRRMSYRQAAPYLLPAALVWAVAVWLPRVAIAEGATDTFWLHTGGGVAAAILFWFTVRAYRLRFAHWWQEPLFLYFFAAGLGATNELFEFGLSLAGILPDKGGDTWWDLTANTLGITLAFLAVRVAAVLRRPS